MDQIQSTDNDEVTDKCGSSYNSSAGHIFDNIPGLGDDGIASGSNNEGKISPEKLPDSLFETESATGENDVSSTSCAENENIPNEAIVERYSSNEAVENYEKDDHSREVNAESCSEQPNIDNSTYSNANNPVAELPSATDHVELPSASENIELPSASDYTDLPSSSYLTELPSHVEVSSASDHIKLSSDVELPLVPDHIELTSTSASNELSSPFDHVPVSSLPCAAASTNAEGSPCSEHVSNAESSPNAEAVSNSDASPNTKAISYAEDSPVAEVVTNAKGSPNTEASLETEAVTNTEAGLETEAITNTEDGLETEAVSNTEVDLEAEAISNTEAGLETEAAMNTEAGLETEAVRNDEAIFDTEAVTNTEACHEIKSVMNTEASLHTDVVTNIEAGFNTVTNTETSLDTDVIHCEASRNHDVTNCEASHNADVTNCEASLDTGVVTNAEASLDTDIVTNGEASVDADVTNAEANTDVVTNGQASLNIKVVTSADGTSCTDVVTKAEASPNTESVINAEASSNADVPTNAEASLDTEVGLNSDVIKPDSSHLPNRDADDSSKEQTVCDSPSEETNVVHGETVDYRNNFLPTISAIRGGCTNVLEKTPVPSSPNPVHEDVSSSTPPEIPSLNIVSVIGRCKDIDLNNESLAKISDPMVVDGAAVSKDCSIEDPDVICIETTSAIPSPIPIKVESNIGDLNVEAESRTPIKNEKFLAKKRLTRSSVPQCVILSSSSDVDDLSDSKKPNYLTNAAYSTAGYTCHLCNTVFQEHELLNEHMILHRNNSLIEAKVQSRSKATKAKTYSCDVCKKQLSTSQALQQHLQVHKNGKPFVCGICQKDFRYLHNYRTHLQNHKVEQQRSQGKTRQQGIKEQLDKSVVRGVDFGRLVGPLFVKENLLHQEKDTGVSKTPPSNAPSLSVTNKKTAFRYTFKDSVSYQPRLSFDKPSLKSNANSSSPVIIRRQEPSPDSGSDQECVAVKSFSNIESVVMNAAKIIVKLDNLDTSVLKRKLQTPDISIDQPPKKCRVMLSPIAERRNVKLDEIENIPMDIDFGEIDLPALDQTDGDRDNYGRKPLGTPLRTPHNHPNNGNANTAARSTCSSRGTLTENELFDLLNDDTVSTDFGGHSTNGQSQLPKPDLRKVDNSTNDSVRNAGSPLPKRSNVIIMEAPPTYEMCAYEDEETIDSTLDDAFDTAFQKVAMRRLALMRKRATENGGKVQSRYLLGPLFWRKALRRAQKRALDNAPVANVDISFSGSKNGSRGTVSRTHPSPFGGRSRFDNRRTNDPTKLQLRAERKFKYLLELAKMLSNLNSLNLAGPLFWRRTLQLAGVHRGEDLRMHVVVTSPTLDGIEFVDDGGQQCDFNSVLVNSEKTTPSRPSDQPPPSDLVQPSSDPVQLPPSHCVRPSEVLTTSALHDQRRSLLDTGGLPLAGEVVADDMSKMADEKQTSHPEPPSNQAVTVNTSDKVASLKTDSILYESLTKPMEKQQPSTNPEGVPTSYVDSTSLFVTDQGTAGTVVESSLPSDAEVLTTEQSNHQLTGEMAVGENIAGIDSGSIVLNVDSGGGLQLIPAVDQVPMAGAGQNLVLVSDGSGMMQYMVNVPGDNFGNFELIGNDADGEQVAYAIQFDGENYAAVQFVQDGSMQLQGDKGMKEAQMLVDPKAATYLVADAGASAATVADPSHIGKELSDFLNLDYGNLMKNGATDPSIS